MMTSDINWMPISIRKNIDIPKIIWEPYNGSYSGYYQQGTKNLVVVEGDEDDTPATIAHEYCHYLQYTRGSKFGKLGSNGLDLFQKHSYNKAIRLYFRSMWWEMEALLFQEKHAPTELGKFWLKALVLPKQFQENIQM